MPRRAPPPAWGCCVGEARAVALRRIWQAAQSCRRLIETLLGQDRRKIPNTRFGCREAQQDARLPPLHSEACSGILAEVSTGNIAPRRSDVATDQLRGSAYLHAAKRSN